MVPFLFAEVGGNEVTDPRNLDKIPMFGKRVNMILGPLGQFPSLRSSSYRKYDEIFNISVLNPGL